MKPPKFSYVDPGSLPETLELLAEHGDSAKVLAGGQSLMPLLNFRLVRPEVVIDINRVQELRGLSFNGGVQAGATVRQRELERAPALRAANPLLAETLPLIGHFQIRNRGTICGSLAHADPAAELPAVAAALDARLTAESRRGKRVIAVDEFFVGPLTTCLAADELLAEVVFPPWDPRDGWAIEEMVRREGDFALAGVVVRLTASEGTCTAARIVTFGLAGRPQRLSKTEQIMLGSTAGEATVEIEELVRSEAEAEDDIHASAAYRSRVAGVLAGRAIARAWERTSGAGANT
jgi:aerobic carbon-monoxide dehydrogenase medium subunit